MDKKLKFGFSECVIIEFILVAIIVMCTIIKQKEIISLAFNLSFIILLSYTYIRIKRKVSVVIISLLTISFLNVIINDLLAKNSNFEFEYFKKIIIFSAFILFLYYSHKDRVNLRLNKIILYIGTFLGLELICSYLFFGNTATYAGGITLNFDNPNFTGMWLLHIMIYTFLVMISSKSKLIKLLLFVDISLLIYLIYLTKARASLLSTLVFILLCLIERINKIKFIESKCFAYLISVFPIAFVAIYNNLLQAGWFTNTFSFIISEGKGLDSRLAVWNPAIEIFKENIFLGNYFDISNGTGTSQLHNMHLDILCSYGIIPFVLFCYLIFCVSSHNNLKNKSKFSKYTLFGFFAIIINGTFEAAIVAGAMGLNILTVGLILLNRSDDSANNIKY